MSTTFGDPEHSGPIYTTVYYHTDVGIWSSFNVHHLPLPLLPFETMVTHRTNASDLRKTRWLHDFEPYLAFYPLRPIFSGLIFSRLDIHESTLRIRPVPGGRYALEDDLIASWTRLEIGLLGLAKFLLRRRFGTLSHFRFMELPSSCGFDKSHEEIKWVSKCAFKSRQAFVNLATACTFAIALNLESESLYREHTWVQACRENGVHSQWLEDLQASFVCDFSPGFRPGAFVNPYTTPWAQSFDAFLYTNVPLWLIWGRKEQVPMYTHMKPYVPTFEEVRQAKANASYDFPTLASTATTAAASVKMPVLYSGS